jgi:hypothetical protein
VWRADPRNPTAERQYGFGYYTINLNYFSEEMKKYLAPTDSRLRLDQRYMEEGKYEMASAEKHRLEEK